jgi:hypothetical protein
MRFLPHLVPALVPALVAAVLASTTLTTSIAHACGGYVEFDPAPRVLAVSSHSVVRRDHWSQRSFVVLEQAIKPAAETLWSLLAPGTYDTTRIITLPQLATPLELTLVGPSGARVVKTDRQVGLSHSWQIGWEQQRVALEVPLEDREQFVVAIEGRATDAKWHAIDHRQAPATVTWWLTQRGIKNPEYVGLRKLAGTSFDIVEYTTNGMTHFIVRDGDRQVGGAADASPLGAVTTKGRSFVVFNMKRQIGLLELPKSTKA